MRVRSLTLRRLFPTVEVDQVSWDLKVYQRVLLKKSKRLARSDKAYSSLSLLLRFAREPLPILGAPPSLLLSSIALRSCSASSYAASRLFIVDRRLWASASALGLVDLPSLPFLSTVPNGDGSGDA